MNGRITTRVVATDPITSVGVSGILRGRPELALAEGPDAELAQVAVAAGHELDDELARLIRSAQCNGCQRVVLLLTRVDDRAVASCVELGVRGILRWAEATPERIVAAVRAACAGEATLAPDLVARLLEHVGMLSRRVLAPQGVSMSGLTQREVQVLRLLADGHDTADIAEQLAYSERTVKTVIHEITSRLQLKNRSHAVAYALRQGLI